MSTSPDDRNKAGDADRPEPRKRPAGNRDNQPRTGQHDTNDPPAGEEMTGEGSPGLTVTGGGGHA